MQINSAEFDDIRSERIARDIATDLAAIRALFANLKVGSAVYDPASLGDAAGATTTITVTGAALGDFVLVSFSLDLQGITLTGYVSATDTVAVRFQNESGGTLDLASGTLRAVVFKRADLVAPAALLTT